MAPQHPLPAVSGTAGSACVAVKKNPDFPGLGSSAWVLTKRAALHISAAPPKNRNAPLRDSNMWRCLPSVGWGEFATSILINNLYVCVD
jgi:hypothetical protein